MNSNRDPMAFDYKIPILEPITVSGVMWELVRCALMSAVIAVIVGALYLLLTKGVKP